MAREDAKGPLQNQTIDVSSLSATDPENPEFRKQAEAEILKRLGVGNSLNAANEWADAACNSVVWLKNIRDGISTPEEALKEMEANIARIRASSNLHCTVPPEGWSCSREPGHEGPCAASPVGEDDLVADLALQMKYMKASHAKEKRRREALEADLRYAKSVCAYEKRHREALEVDLANVNQRLTSANIGLTMAQATAASLPQAISNSDTKRDPELRDALNDHGKAQVEFGLWYSKRYGNPDLTDTWKHAQYQDAREIWMACANLLSDGYQKRARNWRDSFESMHRRAMAAEQVVKDQSIMLSGERGQVEIWKQRAKEWCEKFNALKSEKYVTLADKDAFFAWWGLEVPNEWKEQFRNMAEECLANGTANERLASAWEGFDLGLKTAKSRANLRTLTKEEATALVKEYGRAVLQRNGFQVALTMNNLLDYLVGNLNIVGLARECIEDVISHHDDFVKACEFAKLGERGEDGVSYWTHQVNVLNRMKEQAESVLDNVGDESHHSHLNGGSL